MSRPLFEVGTPKKIPAEVLVKLVMWGRHHLKHSEDDWTEDDLVRIRKFLPLEHRSISLVELKIQCQRVRKDKLCPKEREPLEFVGRIEKLSRDYNKARERQGWEHLSAEYTTYMSSEQWSLVAAEHRKRCEFRCQACGRASQRLEVHHTPQGYQHLGNEMPWHIQALCHEPCHPHLDLLREYGKESLQELPLFDAEAHQ